MGTPGSPLKEPCCNSLSGLKTNQSDMQQTISVGSQTSYPGAGKLPKPRTKAPNFKPQSREPTPPAPPKFCAVFARSSLTGLRQFQYRRSHRILKLRSFSEGNLGGCSCRSDAHGDAEVCFAWGSTHGLAALSWARETCSVHAR